MGGSRQVGHLELALQNDGRVETRVLHVPGSANSYLDDMIDEVYPSHWHRRSEPGRRGAGPLVNVQAGSAAISFSAQEGTSACPIQLKQTTEAIPESTRWFSSPGVEA